MKRGSKSVFSALKSARRVGIDSMGFIYFFEADSKYGPMVKSIFSWLIRRQILSYTSVITIAEVLSVAAFNEQLGTSIYFRHRLEEMDYLHLVPVNVSIAETAAQLRQRYKLKLGDAIQLATAVTSNVEVFITNDKQFRQVETPRIMMLDDYL